MPQPKLPDGNTVTISLKVSRKLAEAIEARAGNRGRSAYLRSLAEADIAQAQGRPIPARKPRARRETAPALKVPFSSKERQ